MHFDILLFAFNIKILLPIKCRLSPYVTVVACESPIRTFFPTLIKNISLITYLKPLQKKNKSMSKESSVVYYCRQTFPLSPIATFIFIVIAISQSVTIFISNSQSLIAAVSGSGAALLVVACDKQWAAADGSYSYSPLRRCGCLTWARTRCISTFLICSKDSKVYF